VETRYNVSVMSKYNVVEGAAELETLKERHPQLAKMLRGFAETVEESRATASVKVSELISGSGTWHVFIAAHPEGRHPFDERVAYISWMCSARSAWRKRNSLVTDVRVVSADGSTSIRGGSGKFYPALQRIRGW